MVKRAKDDPHCLSGGECHVTEATSPTCCGFWQPVGDPPLPVTLTLSGLPVECDDCKSIAAAMRAAADAIDPPATSPGVTRGDRQNADRRGRGGTQSGEEGGRG
jgi:hypothetical protein